MLMVVAPDDARREIAWHHDCRRRMVSVMSASANRDEDHYENPDVFDLDRRADDHLALRLRTPPLPGYHLARLEARLALDAILDRFPDLRLDPDAPRAHITGLAFRSPDAVRVVAVIVDPQIRNAPRTVVAGAVIPSRRSIGWCPSARS